MKRKPGRPKGSRSKRTFIERTKTVADLLEKMASDSLKLSQIRKILQ